MSQELLACGPQPERRAELVDSYRPAGPSTNFRLRQLLAERPLPGDAGFGCYLMASSSRYSDIARAVECRVFQQFFGNRPADMADAYAPYEPQSMFLLAVDRKTQQPAGTLRFITHRGTGLKTIHDVQHEPLSIPLAKALDHHGIDDLDKCWDVGTLAVLKAYRGRASDHFISTMLYGLFHAEIRKHGIEHLVAVLDEHAYTRLTHGLALPFVPLAGSEPFSYLGSNRSRAVYVHVAHARRVVQAYLDALDREARRALGPYLERVLYGDGLPEVVAVT